MALTITPNTTETFSMEATSDNGGTWTTIGSSASLGQNGDIFRVGSNSISCRLDGGASGARGGMQITRSTTIDFDNAGTPRGMIAFWAFTSSILRDTATTGGITVRIGSDASNWVEWQVATGDGSGGQVYAGGWQRYVVDVSQTPDSTTGTITWSAVDYFAIQFDVLTDIMGNIPTIWIDEMNHLTETDIGNGTSAVTITGTTTTAGTFWDEVFSSSANDAEFFVARQGGVFALNQPIEIGATSGTNTFTSQEETCVWQNQIVGTGFQFIRIIGGSGTDTFTWGEKVSGENIGSKGTKILSDGPAWNWISSETDIDVFQLYGCNFEGANSIEFGSTTTALGTTGDTVHLIDNIISSSGRVIRNIGADTIIESGNKILFSTDTSACIDLVDENNIDVTKWDLVQSDGFIHTTAGSPTILTIDYNFDIFTKPYITVDTNETWDLVNPNVTINIGTQDELNFLNATGNSVEKLFDIDINAKRGATNIQNVYAWLGFTTTDGTATTLSENNTLPTANRVTTDVSGDATSRFVQDIYTEATATTLDDTPKTDTFLLAYHYGDLPMFRTLGTVTAKQDFALAVITDPNITETTQATAITNGSGIVLTKDSTTPFAIVYFTNGSGDTISDGDTVTGLTSTESGTFRELVSGSFTGTGAMLLENVTGTFSNGETLDATTSAFTGDSDQTANPQQEFDWGINANAKNMTVVYDYIQARLSEVHANVVTSGFDDVIRWIEDDTGANSGTIFQALGGDIYKTERNTRLGEGVIMWNYGTGTINYFTDNAGNTFVPPTTVPLTIHVERKDDGTDISGASVIILQTSDNSIIAQGTTDVNGDFSANFVYTTDIPVTVRCRKSTLPIPRYFNEEAVNTISSTGMNQNFAMRQDFIASQA